MLHTIAQISAERMLNCLAQGILIALFAWIVLRIVGRRNSGTRFAVWFCALVAIAASPFLQISLTVSSHSTASSAAFTVPRNWALYLFAVWTAFAIVGLARVAAGLWHLWKIRRNCVPVNVDELDPMLQSTLADFRSVRRVEICASEELCVPTVIGFVKPAVVFPAWALSELSADELNTILLHELAHLRRWDDWTNLAQKVLRALFFFHPAVWWVERRLSLEREMACDDIVLAQTSNPRAYAKCLVALAEKNLLLRRGMALAQAAVGRMRQTTQRVLQILDAHRPGGVRVWKPAPWIVGAFSVVCLMGSSHAPKLVAFGDAPHANESQYSAAVSGRSVDAAELPAARIVSAKFVPDAERRTQTVHAHQPAKKSAKPQKPTLLKATETVPAKSARDSARVVQTSASLENENAIPQPAVFVVVEGQQFGNAVVWQVSVWRITVLERDPHLMNQHAAQQNISKSI
jgi:beta-lactamase regulating signal transducer with metallopeptidase domain